MTIPRLTMRYARAAAAAAILLAVALAAPAVLPASQTGQKAQTSQTGPPAIDAFVARAMATFDVPGLALAIVKDGRVVAAKGYGVRRLGEPARVDERTLFGIASNTKVFTAVALGLLVEEGKVEWDAPVVRYLPGFQMWDPYVTRELTVRDLLVHRSGLGLGAGDLLWWPPSTYDRKEIVRRLRHVPPATSFRSAYAYDNVLYLVAGELIETVSGRSWEDSVSERILKPVGMSDSNVRHSDAGRDGNVAATHAPVDGVVRPIKPFLSDNTNPAGGINASATDIARWMLTLLDEGRLPGGARLFSEETAREITTLVTPIRVGNLPPELAAIQPNFRGYGLGLNLLDYRGRKLVTHTGGLPGYVSQVALLPELELGVAVLTNQESAEAFNVITFRVLDHYLGAAPTDWLDAFSKVRTRTEARNAEAEKKAVAARDTASRPSLPLARYAGTYSDRWYGDVAVELEDDKLVMRFKATPMLVGDLEHWQYDTFIIRWRDRELRADAYVTFALDPEGRVDQVKMRAVSPATDFSYDFHDLLLRPADRR